MTWKIKWADRAFRQIEKLDKNIQKNIINYLKDLTHKENPRVKGKPLSNNMKGLWRFRWSDYRMVCQLIDSELVILVLNVGHRKNVYESQK